MKPTKIFTLMLLLGIANASAAAPPNLTQQSIMLRAQEGHDGVIVGVTDEGEIAADTAWLLSAQIKQNADFAPLLLVLKPGKREDVLNALDLTTAMLPALIYYDLDGREISRVIGVYPTAFLKQRRANKTTTTLN